LYVTPSGNLEVVAGFFIVVHGPFIQAFLVGEFGGVSPLTLGLIVAELAFNGGHVLRHFHHAGPEAGYRLPDLRPALRARGQRLCRHLLNSVKTLAAIAAAFFY
jgi:hypothetical protein